jgi:hypothetical protein
VLYGREADAKTDDLKKLVGHTAGSKTTAHVYDRDRIEAHRRIAKARKAKRRAIAVRQDGRTPGTHNSKIKWLTSVILNALLKRRG